MATLSEAYKAHLERSKIHWHEINAPLGKALGYPECCVKAFCALSPQVLQAFGGSPEMELRFSAAHIEGKYTGFIPCSYHADKILNGEITLASLIKNRDSEFPEFPYYGAHEE